MADWEETKKDYIVLRHTQIETLEKNVNAKIKEKYVPYWPLHITEWWTFYQVMVLNTIQTAKVSITWWLWAVWPISWSISVSWWGE